MKLPIKYIPIDEDGTRRPTGLRVRVFHGQSQTTGRLDGFTLAADGTWINLSNAVTYNDLAWKHIEPKRLPLMTIKVDGVIMQLEGAPE